MTKINFILISVFSLLSTESYAENFNGFSISGEVIHNQATGEFIKNESYDADKEKTLGAINIMYSFSIKNDFLMQIGANFDLNKIDIHTFSTKDFSPSTGDIEETKYFMSEKKHFSLYIAPAFKLTNDFLVYGKLAYHYLESEAIVKFSDQLAVDSPDRYEQFINSKRNDENIHHGFGYGLGFKYLLSDNLFTYSEFQRIKFSKEQYSLNREYEPESTRISLGFGYTF